jgi:hypothetical protein
MLLSQLPEANTLESIEKHNEITELECPYSIPISV